MSDSLDTIVEYAGEGHDVVHAKASITLSEHVEDIYLFGTEGYNATGNSGANRILGNGGDNVLSGMDGNDQIDARMVTIRYRAAPAPMIWSEAMVPTKSLAVRGWIPSAAGMGLTC